jgi:rSAM/selenodomain-associated transferase 2
VGGRGPIPYSSHSQLKISIIIPTLEEAQGIENSLSRACALNPHEIIVADGGSQDDTRKIARNFTSHIVQSAPGRALQMNTGAQIASGDILLFLHADSHLSEASYNRMLEVMLDNETVGGAFSLTIDSGAKSLQWISALATLRSRKLNLVYGDQAFFVRKKVFNEMGGYALLPICEDLEFFQRLRKTGRVTLLEEKTITSARRWQQEGIWFTTLRNGLIATLFLMGFSPKRLSKWYGIIR